MKKVELRELKDIRKCHLCGDAFHPDVMQDVAVAGRGNERTFAFICLKCAEGVYVASEELGWDSPRKKHGRPE